MSDPLQDLQERLSRLEELVARLVEKVDAPPASALPRPPPRVIVKPPPPPSSPSWLPLPPPRLPRPQNPIVYVAAGGAGIFLIGAIFFLHWSIQQGWIGPEFRFVLGLLVGGGLAAGAARLILGDNPKLGVCLLLAGLGTVLFTLRWGAFEYHFYPAPLGLAGAACCVLLAGGLAGRARSGAALSVALVAGFLSPLVFSEGGHHEVALAVYLAVLMGAALAVPYLARGARWSVSRWLAVAGTWLLLAGSCQAVGRADATILLALLALHYLLAGLWIWLPGLREERPSTPTLLWFTASLAAMTLTWTLWRLLRWPTPWFAAPVLLLAALNLLMVKPLRRHLGSRQADLGLLILAAGHLALAVPIALDWAWVGPLWGLFALASAWAVNHAEEATDWEDDELRALLILALGMAALATLRWAFHAVDWLGFGGHPAPLFNANFLEGLLAAGAWALLVRRGKGTALESFICLEIVGNVVLAMELGRIVRYAGGEARMASIVVTLAWALGGALQWLGSLSGERTKVQRMLAVAGYAWLGIASCKLLLVDLSGADTPKRALAFLGVGAIFLTAALVANRARQKRKEVEL